MIYARYDPSRSFLFPKCPVYTLTGLKCPGCGSQRAVHALLNCDLVSAFRHNALAVILLPYIFIVLGLKAAEPLNGFPEKLRGALVGNAACIVILSATLVFTVARNIF